ncbi:MAG: hypothetical protein EZS26_001571 [Candidatus Ordinivivax streblomastigis]|jgi:hypothetical protein|uniref:Uncharacterized protein n=1 Tax=Candidatus Ordinivivax streblomastigis TaxID=2540710 RepID=A0A5M8P1B8_9BACT|nr:MAG: hypothetical protein EZS26_001571 [Candidatus Ordinivivax streblomastigis]
MKKLLIFSVALCACGLINAQTQREVGTTTKSGQYILPQAGDFAIQVNADPFLKYAGNLLTSASNSAPTFENFGVVGKYFLSNDRALRVGLSLGLDKETTKALIPDVTTPTEMVENLTKVGSTDVYLNVGYEFRRGYGRLQGFYGAEAVIGYSSTTTNYEYGNKLSATNPLPRNLSNTTGGRFSFGLGGFTGVEYFIAPKISIGAEVGLAFAISTAPKGESVAESWDGSKVKETSVESYTGAGYTSFSTMPKGNLFIAFHF